MRVHNIHQRVTCLLGEKKAGGSWTAKEIKMSESKAEANLLLFLQVKHTITGW